jgi:glycosyltransferase involved in cell wall biosynthesis
MKINLYSPIGSTGYGNASLNLLKALNKLDIDVCLSLIGSPNIESQENLEVIKKCIHNQETADYNAPCVKIWHQFDLLSRVGNGKYYAYPFFEIDTFNNQEKHHLNFPDHLIVSSEWAKEVVINNGIHKNISVVPLGVDTSIFNAHQPENRPNNFIFITVGKWEIRKSHDIVIECFNKAFSNNDNVELWMITNNPFLTQQQEAEWMNLVESSKLSNKIKVFPRMPSQHNIAEVLSYADCGLYVSRAEGWNLDLLETMAMNKPVIVTNYSAHTEYCNADNSYLVDIDDKELAIDNKWFHGTGNWAKIGNKQIDQIVGYMKYVYENKINSNPEGLKTAKAFSWEHSAEQLLRCIGS